MNKAKGITKSRDKPEKEWIIKSRKEQ